MAQIPIGTRLAAYGLTEQQVQLADLRLERNQVLVVSRQDPTLGNRLIQLQPPTVQQAKEWIGVPDAALGHLQAPAVAAPLPAIGKLGEVINPGEHAVLTTLAQHFVFRHSEAISPTLVPILNDWLQRVGHTIHFFAANDIHISAGARLVVAPDVFVIFARYITIEETATIVIQGNAAKIDCAGLTATSPILNLPHFGVERLVQ
jgi:hypothetical protein